MLVQKGTVVLAVPLNFSTLAEFVCDPSGAIFCAILVVEPAQVGMKFIFFYRWSG